MIDLESNQSVQERIEYLFVTRIWPRFQQLQGFYLDLNILILKQLNNNLRKSCFDHLRRKLRRKVKKLSNNLTRVNPNQSNGIFRQGLKIGQNWQNFFSWKLLNKSAQTFNCLDSNLVFEVPQKSTKNWKERILTNFLSKSLG